MYKELSKISLIIIISGLTSCKKERLNGEYEVLVGTWEYNYSQHWSSNCDPFPLVHDTIFSQDLANMYSIEFIKKGIINYKIDGVTTKSYKIKFGPTNSGFSGFPESVSTYLYLDGNEENSRVCHWDGTILLMTGFPFKTDSCDTYTHYFLPG